jgi:hypothetical protein
MKIISVPFIELNSPRQTMLPLNPIDNEPWSKKTNLSCEASFSMSHFNEGLRIQFSVIEPFLSVKKRKINEAVHKDNCVEIFIAFENEKGYYNFEFNCLGSIKAAFGDRRVHRRFLPSYLLKLIQDSVDISLDNGGIGNRIRWTIDAVIPISAFLHHHLKSFSGLTCSVNFTKCGDDLPEPHFLSWVNLTSDTPNFHQPSSFGKLIFEPNTNVH